MELQSEARWRPASKSYLCTSLIDDARLDPAPTHPVCHHEPGWPSADNEDIDLRVGLPWSHGGLGIEGYRGFKL
jgi:hypothetical protein